MEAKSRIIDADEYIDGRRENEIRVSAAIGDAADIAIEAIKNLLFKIENETSGIDLDNPFTRSPHPTELIEAQVDDLQRAFDSCKLLNGEHWREICAEHSNC